MKKNHVLMVVSLCVLLIVAGSVGATGAANPAVAVSSPGVQSAGYLPDNRVSLPGLPAFGKWLIAPDGAVASWLGYKINGKAFQEPINIILVDGVAKSAADANARLLRSCTEAGYDNMQGHSSGYFGFIGEKLYGQFPGEANRAFSNTFFWVANNHGRVFGPHYHEGKYYYIAAFSREGIDMNTDVKHVYDSFVTARDDFAKRLAATSTYQIGGKVNLQNGLPNNPAKQTVGDHDGTAVLLEAVADQ